MWDNVDLGQCPFDEECAQYGVDRNYRKRATAELIQLKRMMYAIWPPPRNEIGAYKITSNPYDENGSYLSLAASYDMDSEAGAEWAWKAEDKVPARWDDEARRLLAEAGFLKIEQEV